MIIKRPKSTNPLKNQRKLKQLLEGKSFNKNSYKNINQKNIPKLPINHLNSYNFDRPKTSMRNIQKLNLFSRNTEENLDVLNLIIETNPSQYNYKKIGNKIKEINPLFTKGTDANLQRPHFNINTEEVFYKYNLLYGNNSKNLIRTYSPKMRPKSASVSVFMKKMSNALIESKYIFTEEEVIALIYAKCKDIGIDVRENMISKFQEYCNAKCKNRCLDLSENHLGINSAKVLRDILYSSDRIARINLTKNNLGDEGVKILLDGLKNSLSLLSLNLTSNSLTHKGGIIIFSTLWNHQSLIDINISSIEGTNRNRLTAIGINQIENFLKTNIFIESLNLAGNSIRNEGFVLVSKGLNENQYLTKLNLSNNEIQCKGLKKGLSIITLSKIVSLNISYNTINNEGIICLTDSLKNFQNLKIIDVSFCGIEFKGFLYLINNLENIKRIESLNISGNDIKGGDYELLKIPFASFGLRNLNMSKCSLTDDNTMKLGLCLIGNETIKYINISHNGITDQGFKSFKPLFTRNNTIEKFDCSSNFISDISAKEFVKNIKFNRSLKKINFYDNQLHNEMGSIFLEVLDSNKNLVSIKLVFNRIQMKTIDEINRLLKINKERQKAKIMPILQKSIKFLQFDPELFKFFTENIISKKQQQNSLYKKVRQDDRIFTSLLKKEDNKIIEKITEMKNINTQITDYEAKIKEIRSEIENLDQQMKSDENDALEKIKLENKIIQKIKNDYLLIKAEYDSTKKDLDFAQNEAKEKVNYILNKYTLAKKSYNTMIESLKKKQKYYSDLMNPDLIVPIGTNGNNKVTETKNIGKKKKNKDTDDKKEIDLEKEDALKLKQMQIKNKNKNRNNNISYNKTTEQSETKTTTKGNVTERSENEIITGSSKKEILKNNLKSSSNNKIRNDNITK